MNNLSLSTRVKAPALLSAVDDLPVLSSLGADVMGSYQRPPGDACSLMSAGTSAVYHDNVFNRSWVLHQPMKIASWSVATLHRCGHQVAVSCGRSWHINRRPNGIKADKSRMPQGGRFISSVFQRPQPLTRGSITTARQNQVLLDNLDARVFSTTYCTS